MNLEEKKKITLSLIETFNKASQVALDLREAGLKKEIKSDNTPVSNGDIEVNKILTSKIQEITPNIAIVSEESALSSETIAIFGVISWILLVKILLTSISPLLTGVLSDLISFFKPASLRSKAT